MLQSFDGCYRNGFTKSPWIQKQARWLKYHRYVSVVMMDTIQFLDNPTMSTYGSFGSRQPRSLLKNPIQPCPDQIEKTSNLRDFAIRKELSRTLWSYFSLPNLKTTLLHIECRITWSVLAKEITGHKFMTSSKNCLLPDPNPTITHVHKK